MYNAYRPSNRIPLLKKDVEYAIGETHSMAQAANYLNINYKTFKKWAKLYGLFNPNLKKIGIPKSKNRTGVPLQDIFDGKHPNYNINRLKERLIGAAVLLDECGLCGYAQKNPITNKTPLVIYFLDGDRHNLQLDNLQLRCYNCLYITSDRQSINVQNASNSRRIEQQDMLSHHQISESELEQLQEEISNEVSQ
jgi:hypothetical protein